MPYEKKYNRRKRYRKKRFRRRKKTMSNARNMITRSYGNVPFPVKKLFKTRYSEVGLSINPGLGTAGSYVFSCNSLYDPNRSGSGHQPIGFDQMMLMYDHYTVIGSAIRVTFDNKDVSNSQIVGVYIRDTSSGLTDPLQLIENGSAKWAHLNPAGQGGSSTTITFGVNPNKWLGRSKPLAEDDLRGNSSSNPAEECYFVLFAFSPSGADSGQVDFYPVIDYVSVLTEPKTLATS